MWAALCRDHRLALSSERTMSLSRDLHPVQLHSGPTKTSAAEEMHGRRSTSSPFLGPSVAQVEVLVHSLRSAASHIATVLIAISAAFPPAGRYIRHPSGWGLGDSLDDAASVTPRR